MVQCVISQVAGTPPRPQDSPEQNTGVGTNQGRVKLFEASQPKT